ncbi:SusF/SusE family outer membrane protein [Flavobacteriaceae bacterium 14752]|uniref:SusF/SusE family outer membrane protein n=1 Tax=Mesohalobacter salilacus TaxID=2491711 RepID=UPI000F63B121|nr:SusF/SusE family outer membrane protein [Flavobacteriaceae bacterium 14752]
MKNKILILTIICLGLFGLKSCTDDDNFRFQTPAEVEQLTITNSLLGEYLLSTQTFPNVAERFTWETPDFGVQSNISYDLEYSVDGTFENPIVVGSTTETQLSITVEQLWNLATTELGLDNDPETNLVDENGDPVLDEAGNPIPNDAGEMFFRVVGNLGTNEADNSPNSISDVQIVFVRLLSNDGGGDVPLIDLFLVGNATAAGWDNNNNNTPIIRDPENPDVYTFTGKFSGNPNEFKLLEERGAWQPQWGLDNGVFSSSDDLGFDPGSFVVSGSEGYYSLTVNTADGTSEFIPFDETGSTTFATIGIIGSATTGDDTGWSADMDMTQSSFDPHLWYMTGLELFDGEAKFRADNDWAVNWGSNTELTGFASQDGPNIPVAAGTYDVWFNDLSETYVFVRLEE